MKAVSKSKIRAFYKAHLEDQLSAIESCFQKLKKHSPDLDPVFGKFEEVVSKDLMKQYRKDIRQGDTRFKIEFSEDRLNQSELLLLVAHFESFMKEVHSTFLNAAPAKVFSGSDKKVMLRDVFGGQGVTVFSKFLNELIIKEVKFLDSQRIEKRAEYFSEHYGVSFGSGTEINELKEIMEIRNKIPHEIYAPLPSSPEQVRDQALVGDEMLKRARQLFRYISSRCVEAGAKAYQSYFRSGE